MDTFGTAVGLLAEVFAFAAFLAFVSERLVEQFIKPALVKFGYQWATPYVALAVGLAASLGFRVDLVTPLAVAVGLDPLGAWVGQIITGLTVGGGSHFIHDLWADKIRA